MTVTLKEESLFKQGRPHMSNIKIINGPYEGYTLDNRRICKKCGYAIGQHSAQLYNKSYKPGLKCPEKFNEKTDEYGSAYTTEIFSPRLLVNEVIEHIKDNI